MVCSTNAYVVTEDAQRWSVDGAGDGNRGVGVADEVELGSDAMNNATLPIAS